MNTSLTDQDGQSKEITSKPPAIFDVAPGTYNLVVNVERLPTLHMQVKVDRQPIETSSGSSQVMHNVSFRLTPGIDGTPANSNLSTKNE